MTGHPLPDFSMPRPRNILTASVLKAKRTGRISIAAPGDFDCGPGTACDRAALCEAAALPYCFDFLRRRSLYVGGGDVVGAQQAAFYYLYLRQMARTVFSVPWEAGPIYAAGTARPVLLFSPGRCGSTLLSRILFEAGVPSVSEPDFYTQAAGPLWRSPVNPMHGQVCAALGAMSADLATAFGGDGVSVAKLRAECCRAPAMLLGAASRRTIFMIRDFAPWAESTIRIFRRKPDFIIGKYMDSLRCLFWLRNNAECHVVRYEDLLADAGASCAALAGFLGRPISTEAVGRAMESDSQSDSPLERGRREPPHNWQAMLEETLRRWQTPKVQAAREQLGISWM
jgi:hypothetical protein